MVGTSSNQPLTSDTLLKERVESAAAEGRKVGCRLKVSQSRVYRHIVLLLL